MTVVVVVVVMAVLFFMLPLLMSLYQFHTIHVPPAMPHTTFAHTLSRRSTGGLLASCCTIFLPPASRCLFL